MNSNNIKTLAKTVAEAIKHPNATTRHLRQYPVSDKDIAKPVKRVEKKGEKKGLDEGSLIELYTNTLKSYKKKASDEVNALKQKQELGQLSDKDFFKKQDRLMGITGASKRIDKRGMTGVAEDVTKASDDDKFSFIDHSKGHTIKGKSGTFVGYTHSKSKGKGANILKHNETGKYYAAGGSSTAFTQKTTLHDSPQAAAKVYHKGHFA